MRPIAGAPRRFPASQPAGYLADRARSPQPAPGSPDKPGTSGPRAVGAPRGTRGPFPPGLPGPRVHTYCCRGCRSRRGAAGPGGSEAPCPRLRTAAAAAPSDRKPDPHRTTKEGGRGWRAGGPAGSREGQPAPEAEVAQRGVEAGVGRETGSREEEAGAARRAEAGGRGQPSAPGSPFGPCVRSEPRCGSRRLGLAARAPTSNFPGAARSRGAGDSAATNGREAPAPPPPPQHASRPRGGVGSSLGPHRRPGGREGLQPVMEEGLVGLSRLRRRLRLLLLPSPGPAEFWQPAD